MTDMPWTVRLAKWRSVLSGWQLGTRSIGDPESDAVRDHREVTLLLRAELNALIILLAGKDVVTVEEFTAQVEVEARHLCDALANRFPGFVATDEGIQIDERAAATTNGWRP